MYVGCRMIIKMDVYLTHEIDIYERKLRIKCFLSIHVHNVYIHRYRMKYYSALKKKKKKKEEFPSWLSGKKFDW